MDKKISLEKYLREIRKVEGHRTNQAELEIRRIYKKILKEVRHFLADEYGKMAADGSLTYAILQQKNEYANFLEITEKNINSITPEISKLIKKTVEETYQIAYVGMIEAVQKANTIEQLHLNLKGVKASTPEIIKRAVENPIAGLTLKDTLEKNRKEIIYNIKREIGIGLTNGDRYTNMAERVKRCINNDYEKAIRIVRTETHRVQEAGNLDSAIYLDDMFLEENYKIYTTKTWRTMRDARVRKNKKANHVKLEGVTLPIRKEFELGCGIKTMAPGNSGDARNDIHCRCYLEYDLK